MTATLVATRWGTMLVPPFDQYVGRSLMATGEFSPEELRTWLPYIPVGGVVIDVGANVGAHTLAFSRLVGPSGCVVAYEPQRALVQMLGGSLELNGCDNVLLVPCAVGAERGYVTVPRLSTTAPNNHGGLALDGCAEGERTPVITLDSSFGGVNENGRIDFLKIDVEGHELRVLQGANETVTRYRPVISAEADRESQVDGLLYWFAAHGYRVYWHRPPLGDLFPGVVSINLLALPRDRSDLPDPVGFVEANA